MKPLPVSPAELRSAVQEVLPEVIALRHDLHRNPELSLKEERTARVVSELLTLRDIPHETGVGDSYGIIATIEGAGVGGTIALRGDMDALPIQEENETPYRSTIPGVMHACGHDGHTANLLGTAVVLHRLRDRFAGTVRLLFQPAEEIVSGAKRLVAAGAVEGVDAAVMLHGWPSLPPGQIGLRTGPAMASSDGFNLTIRGKGGHGAYPHQTVDPIYIGTAIVQALQSLSSREVSPTNPVVVSVTQFHAGTAKNIIPEKAELGATVRTLDRTLRQEMAEKIERIIAGVCAAFRAEYDFEYHYGTPVTTNDAAVTELIRQVGIQLLGAENVVELNEPTMGAEDFAYYLEHVPGAMFRLGTGCPSALHTPKYDFGDTPLEAGILMMCGIALGHLGGVTA